MAVTQTTNINTTPRSRHTDYPDVTGRFHLLATVLLCWVVLGIYVDVNAHNRGAVDDTFFTPWHLMLYSGVAVNGLMLVVTQYRNVGRGYAWSKALPRGYMTSLVGVLVFCLAGGFDFLWHTLFGFEVDVEALLSPAHLLLATGGTLFIVGPIRALWGQAQQHSGWRQLLPVIVSATMMLSVLTLFTQYINILPQPSLYTGRMAKTYLYDVAGVASVLMPAILLTATLLLLIRRWRLPLGTVTFMLTLNAVLMFYLRIGYESKYAVVLLAPVLAGVVGDVLLVTQRPSVARVKALRLFAFTVPFVYFLSFFVILMVSDSIWWTIHMWLGVSFLAGIAGLGLSYLLAPPAIPVTEA